MSAILGTYYEAIGMTPASVLTTTFGMFVFVFVVSLCWGRLVQDFGPLGGMLASGVIVGSIWIMNHALPGAGFGGLMPCGPEACAGPEAYRWVGGVFARDAAGHVIQPGLVFQSHRFGGPWIDMGWAAAVGLWVGSAFAGGSVRRSLPSLTAAVVGGAAGGGLLGLVSYAAAR